MQVELLAFLIGLLQVRSSVEFEHMSWYRPAAQTQADVPRNEVMFTGQLEHCLLPASLEICPVGHLLHSGSPLPLKFPGEHIAQFGRVVVAVTSVGDALP